MKKKHHDRTNVPPERDKRGRYAKGHKGGPGRKKGDVKDLLFKDGKKRSTEELIQDLLATYVKLGSNKMLYKWAIESRRNLKQFLDLLFKFAPLPKAVDSSDPRSPIYQASERFMPKLEIIFTDERPDEHGGPKMKMPRPGDIIDKKMKEMEDRLRERDAEIDRLRSIFKTHNIDENELSHEPVRPIPLPESSEAEIDKKIEDAERRKLKLEAELEEKGK